MRHGVAGAIETGDAVLTDGRFVNTLKKKDTAMNDFRTLYIDFGVGLESMLESIVHDESLVSLPAFAAALSAAASEWCSTAHTFNAGNETSFNLNRSGRLIDAIGHTCCNAIADKWRWECVLRDVRRISKIVRFEFRHNVLKPQSLVVSSIGFEYADCRFSESDES